MRETNLGEGERRKLKQRKNEDNMEEEREWLLLVN